MCVRTKTWSGYLGKGREGTLEVVKLSKDVVEWIKEIFLNSIFSLKLNS